MSANYNEDTAFPYLNPHIREDYPITTNAIDDWIKRMVADFEKEIDGDEFDVMIAYNEACDKWFSQFRNNKE